MGGHLMAKRGRKPAKPRDRRERVDRVEATPEAILKKAILVGAGNNLTMAESPIGVMVARRIITVADECHLRDVARLWRFRNGNPSPTTLSEGKSLSTHDSETKTERYKEVHKALGLSWGPIIDVAVYHEYPRWLLDRLGAKKMAAQDRARMGRFNMGLRELTRLWGLRIPVS